MVISIERHISSPRLRAIIDYWSTLRGDRPAPQVSDLDALDIPKPSLPFVLIADLQEDPFRVKYRVVGTHVTALAGNYANRFLDQLRLPEDLHQHMTRDYDYVARACQPISGRYLWPKLAGEPVVVEYTILPLLTGDRVTKCLCGEHINDQEHGDLLLAEDLHPVPWRETAA